VSYSEEERKLVREGGIDAIRQVLTGSDTEKKRSLLLCLDWFMDPYYNQDISSFKEELIALLETVIVSPNPIKVKDDALQLLSDYCRGPFPTLEQHVDEIEDELKANAEYTINMHREAQIQKFMDEECIRIWGEYRNKHGGTADRVWVLFDRNTNVSKKHVLEMIYLLENGERRYDVRYPGKPPKKTAGSGTYLEPEIRFNILLKERKAVLTYAFSASENGGFTYGILGEDGSYSLSSPSAI
ncbi:MAG: hypothetical protein IK106_05420, partial [Clostridiales bacterium]|nr:hypothetical protein [Clostridiales bacterium]